MMHHDTDLYNLTVKTSTGTEVIHTTSNHPLWDPYLKQWRPAAKLTKGEHLKSPGGSTATVVGGTTPKIHDGWMWDLTVPGNNDHDFYVVIAGSGGVSGADTESAAVLVHNEGGCINGSPKSVKTFGHTFNEHGSGAGNLRSLTDRARSTGNPQGQWVDNQAAAEFLKGVYSPDSGPFGVRIPEGLGRVILPDGSIVDAPYAYVIPNANGVIRTAYPTLGEP
jgi:hypothetical protein